MNNIAPAIVVIAFNRPHSLNRLLDSLAKADYKNRERVTLIISIDNANNNQKVLSIAENFHWKFGEKIINYEPLNIGLRKHVLKCASYSLEYGSIILLEDDLFVSPAFYHFAIQSLEFSINKNYIAGISLYNHQYNVNIKSNFTPIEDGFDNWYFQFASSWGQAWTKEQWISFLEWYNQQIVLEPSLNVPLNVTKWSSKSWLKYFIYYLVETKKYFLYPKISLSTNFSDTGTHINENTTAYQVPLNYSNNTQYKFSKFEDSMACYDVFFENLKLNKILNLDKEDLSVDLYGTKPFNRNKFKFLLTSRIYNFRILSSYACQLKPRDANIIQNISGNDFFLYDTTFKVENPNKYNFFQTIMYEIKYINRTDSKKLFLTMYYNRIRLFIKEIKDFLGTKN